MEMGHFHVPKAPLINHKVPIDEGGKNASITLFFRRKDDYVVRRPYFPTFFMRGKLRVLNYSSAAAWNC